MKECEICYDKTTQQIRASCGHMSYICIACQHDCDVDDHECAKCENEED